MKYIIHNARDSDVNILGKVYALLVLKKGFEFGNAKVVQEGEPPQFERIAIHEATTDTDDDHCEAILDCVDSLLDHASMGDLNDVEITFNFHRTRLRPN